MTSRCTSLLPCRRLLSRSNNLDQLFGVLLSLQRGTPRYSDWVIACLSGAWSRLLGDRLAAACRPARFDGSKLIVEILDGNWTEAIQAIKPELTEKLRTITAGEVKSVSVVSGQSAAKQ
jgi:hypothetical protein